MENAVEALKTAAAVLVFVIAITVSFTMFSKAKSTADAVVKSQDDQEYLEVAELDTTLYTSSDAIATTVEGETPSDATESKVAHMTTKGDRIVDSDDVISTIYRYNLEKYGVTIVKSDGTVIARFDSNTENVMRQWYNIAEGNYTEQIKKNISNDYATSITLNKDILEGLYAIKVDGGAKDEYGNTKIKCGAPWYGNETEIIKRINADINGHGYEYNGQTYDGKGIKSTLDGAQKIIEVVNEIDNSQYLEDGETKTSLLQQYELPTIEVVYIIY